MLKSLTAPGPRGLVRRLFVTFLAALLSVSVAWAGAVLAPAPDLEGPLGAASGASFAEEANAVIGEGQMLVGAAKVSMMPRPDDYAEEFPGATWLQGEENHDACAVLSEGTFNEIMANADHAAHLATATASPWPENPDCLYSGGFGIGPANPILDWDRHPTDPGYDPAKVDDHTFTGNGLWVRTVILSDGTDETVLTIIDAEGYLYEYASKCESAQRPGCGARGIAERLGAELDIDPDAFVIAATHAHSSPDLIGGWGFVPDWYFAQVVDTIEQSIRDAHASMTPAYVEIGEETARDFNGERRDTYRSAEEQQLTWLRAVDAADGESVIATVGAYAGHPTSYGTNDNVGHADWPAIFEARLEERFGGIGLHFMTGLGNMSNRSGRLGSAGLANLVPAVGEGRTLTNTDIRATAARWNQPVTNAPLSALGLPGFFDRSFNPAPAQIRTGQSPDTAPCLSASPTSVQLQASAIRVGDDFALIAAPGEVFSNLTNTVKEKSGSLVTMPLGQANDALGYMPQQFEIHEANQQGAGFVAGGVLIVNYEDSYAIDRCTGDHVLETSIDMLDALRDQ